MLKIKKKYYSWKDAFIRFESSKLSFNFEINYSIYDWALPLNVSAYEYLLEVRVLCISLIIIK